MENLAELTLHLRIAGVGLVLLAALHPFFPKRFGWKEDLAKLSLLNRNIFVVHTVFITATVLFMGILSLVFTRTLVEPTPLARVILAGLTLFWGLRLVIQWTLYDRRLWRGHRAHTLIHAWFTCFWTYLTAVYGFAFWRQLDGWA